MSTPSTPTTDHRHEPCPACLRTIHQRDDLLAAAKAALAWIDSATVWDDGLPYVNGRFAGEIITFEQPLRAAIQKAEE